MNRATLLAVVVAPMVIVGVVITFLLLGGREEHPTHTHHTPTALPAAPDGKPLDAIPAKMLDIEVFFINALGRIPIPIDTPTVIDRGDVLTDSTEGSGGWETKVIRTTTHLTITHESDIVQYRKLEHTVPLSALPMDFPHDKIQTMVDGRFEVTKDGQSPGPAGHDLEVLFAGHEVLYAGRELVEIPYGRHTTIKVGSLTPTSPQDGSGWETAIRRTGTHVIIVTIFTRDGQSKATEYPVPLIDLPLELPTEKIPSMVHGRLSTTVKR